MHLSVELSSYLYDRKNHNVSLNKPDGNNEIYNLLISNKPCLVSRFGSVELELIMDYEKNKFKKNIFWNKKNRENINILAGVFPDEDIILKNFVIEYINSSKKIDIIGSWGKSGESYVINKFCKHATIIPLESIEPYYFSNPWSRILEGKRILVIHPFEKSIQFQYNNSRDFLFSDKNVLPFFELKTLKAIQSLAQNETIFNNWFDALSDMKEKISQIDYDIALIGAGAYGLPLGAFIKERGKQAVHMGGATQLLFGIYGKRWENRSEITSLINNYWIRPEDDERPKSAILVENACYW